MIVDDEESAGCASEVAEEAGQDEEVAPGKELVAQLEYFGAPAQGRGGNRGNAVGLLVGSYDVKAGGEEPLEEWVSRSAVNLPARAPPPALRAHVPAGGEDT